MKGKKKRGTNAHTQKPATKRNPIAITHTHTHTQPQNLVILSTMRFSWSCVREIPTCIRGSTAHNTPQWKSGTQQRKPGTPRSLLKRTKYGLRLKSIGWQRATRRNGLVTTRNGLLVGIPKHGVSWKGDYIEEGVFATRVPKTEGRDREEANRRAESGDWMVFLFEGPHQILGCVLFQ